MSGPAQYEAGRDLAESLNPGIELALRDRYERWLPGGMPAMINAMNAAIDVFEAEEAA